MVKSYSVGVAPFLSCQGLFLFFFFFSFLCQNILEQEQVSFHKKRYLSLKCVLTWLSDLCDLVLPVLGDLPIEQAYILYLICPNFPKRHLYLFSRKPLTLLQILVNSDVWTTVNIEKNNLSICTDVKTEPGLGQIAFGNNLWQLFYPDVQRLTATGQFTYCLINSNMKTC